MKKIIIGMMALLSVSAFAAGNCTYVSGGEEGNKRALDWIESDTIVEKALSEKGYTKVYDESKATYQVYFWTQVLRPSGAHYHHTFGDNFAYVTLLRLDDSKRLFNVEISSVSGLIGSIARKAKSKVLLKRILSSFPDCSQLK